MSMGSGDRNHIHPALDQCLGVRQDTFAIQLPESVARGRNGRAANQPETGIF